MRKKGNLSRLATAVVVGALVTACSGGPSESEFVAACMTEGQGVASQMLDDELGITREAFCTCGAPVAKSSLSSDGYRAMILDMQGKREEASRLTSQMSESEQQAAVEVIGKMLETCGGAAK
jgi:geranylgeranyl pyrophosphate synthase